MVKKNFNLDKKFPEKTYFCFITEKLFQGHRKDQTDTISRKLF
jgi:hypothetical protein